MPIPMPLLTHTGLVQRPEGATPCHDPPPGPCAARSGKVLLQASPRRDKGAAPALFGRQRPPGEPHPTCGSSGGAALTRFEQQRPVGVPHLVHDQCGGAVLTRFEQQRPRGVPHPTQRLGGGAALTRCEEQRPPGVPHPAMPTHRNPTHRRVFPVSCSSPNSCMPAVRSLCALPPL